MGQNFSPTIVTHTVSVVAADPNGHRISTNVQARDTDRGHSISVLKFGPEVTDRRVTGIITATQRLPDLFFGFSELSSGEVRIANFDGLLNFLEREENRGTEVRIRRFDEFNQELSEIFTGVVDQLRLGDEVAVSFVSHRLDAFDVELPRNKVFTQSAATGTDADIDVTAVFPDAQDVNAPIPILFGRASDILCQLVRDDRIENEQDYLVCEGRAEVESISKNGQPAYTETGAIAASPAPTSTATTLASTADGSSAFYVGLVIRITHPNGGGPYTEWDLVGQEAVITAYDETTRVATHTAWPVGTPLAGYGYEIREYQTVHDTYKGRTAIRAAFPFADASGGQQEIRATAVRYQGGVKNRLAFSEEQETDGRWIHGAQVTFLEKVRAPSGALDGTKLLFGLSDGIAQNPPLPIPTNGIAYTFSVWLRSPSPAGVGAVDIRLSQASGPLSTTSHVLTTTWTRVSVTRSSWSPGNGSVLVSIDMTTSGILEVFGAQLELGASATSYMPVAGAGQGFRWSFPDAIAELLEDRVWGLGQQINRPSFDTANTDLDGLFLRCQGAIPDVRGTGGTGKTIVDELLKIRGMRLRNLDGAWELLVDKVVTTSGTVGAADTAEQNIIEVGELSQQPVDEVVKEVVLLYNLRQRQDSAETLFAGEFRVAANAIGNEEVVEARFVRDAGTGSRYAQYLAGKLQMTPYRRSFILGQAGRVLQVGNLLTVHIPRHMSENRLVWSERVSQSPWTGIAVTMVEGRNHLELAQRMSQGTWTTVSQRQDTSIAAAGQKAIFTCWARATTSAAIDAFRLRLTTTTGSETKDEIVTLGQSWQKVQVVHRFRSTSTGNIRVEFGADTGKTVNARIAAVQLALEYDFQYARTESTAKPVQETWQLIDVTHEGVDRVSVEAIPFDSTVIFAYQELNPILHATTAVLPDVSFRAPDLITQLTGPPSPPNQGTAQAGIDMRTDGSVDSWAIFKMLVPRRNVVRVDVQVQVVDRAFGWETKGSAPISESDLGRPLEVMVRGLTAGLPYEARAIAVNSRGLATVTPAVNFIAYGDKIAPVVLPSTGSESTSDHVKVTQGTGRIVDVRVVLNASAEPADWGVTRFYRNTSNSFPGEGGFIGEAKGARFLDATVSIGTEYWYFAIIVDLSGNQSAVLGDGGVADPNEPNRTGSVTGVEETEIESILVTGSVPGGSTGITIRDDASAQIRFETATPTLLARCSANTIAGLEILPGANEVQNMAIGKGAAAWLNLRMRAAGIEMKTTAVSPAIELTDTEVRLIVDSPDGIIRLDYGSGAGKIILDGVYPIELRGGDQEIRTGLVTSHVNATLLNSGIKVLNMAGTVLGWIPLYQD